MATKGLRCDDDLSGLMLKPYGTFGFIDMLATLPGRAKGHEFALPKQVIIVGGNKKLGHIAKKCFLVRIMRNSTSFTWFITDIDGTLIDDDGNLPERNREALQHCRDQGIPVVLATGRRWTTLLRLLDRLHLEDYADYAVLNNGMVINVLRLRQTLHCESFPKPAFYAALSALERLNIDPIVLCHDPKGEVDVYHRHPSLMNGDFLNKNVGHCRYVADFKPLGDLPLVEFILLGPESELSLAQEAIRHLPLETALIRNTFYSGYMLEVTPLGISKCSGALRVGTLLGQNLMDAVAIGDSANDLPLLKRVGRSIAVGNASDLVRQTAHETVANGELAGVAEAVFKHFRPARI